MLLEENWDADKIKIKSKEQNSARLNLQLTTRFAELQGEVIEKKLIQSRLLQVN